MAKIQKKVSIIIPCFNEERGIGQVIRSIPCSMLRRMGFATEIIVIDNNSSDMTAEIAGKCGARVVCESRQGKGYAIIQGFKCISPDSDIVVMLDGDNTYMGAEIMRLIEPIDSRFCDVVIGSRMSGKIISGAMSRTNRLGNWLFTFLVRVGYHGNVTDVCSGYFAWDRKVIDAILPHLKSNGFSIEMEMIAKMARMSYDIISVPITYCQREGKSSLNPVVDGMGILRTWFVHLGWRPEPGTAVCPVCRDTSAKEKFIKAKAL